MILNTLMSLAVFVLERRIRRAFRAQRSAGLNRVTGGDVSNGEALTP